MIFANPELVHLFWLAALAIAALVLFEIRSGSRRGDFLSETMQRTLVFRHGITRRSAKTVLIGASLLFGIIALMRPQEPGGTESVSTRQVRADIMIVLDVSRSMLAEDAAPNRLARAKAEIREFIDRVTGHRVGLVAFAGRASVMSPLTSDYGYFRLVLRGVDTRSAGRGGTRIGDAIRKATRAFGPPRNVPRIMLLITDGEDHDSLPEDAIAETVEAAIRVIAIGIGSEEGSTLVVTDPETRVRTTVRDENGSPVISRLDGDLLRKLALETQGVYIPAGTSLIDLDSIVSEHVEPIITDSLVRMVRRTPIEYFQWFVAASLACFLMAIAIGAASGRRLGTETRGAET